MGFKTLRPYQDAAEKSLWKYINENPSLHPLIVAPVAAGKSLMIAEFIRNVHLQFPRTKIVMLTHVKELLTQNAEELMSQYPNCDFGFYCAGLGQKRLHNDIVFASIQSIHNKVALFDRIPQIIIIDECHLISHKSTTQYRKFIDAVLAINPNCRVIGYTGTPFRADTGRLDDGENKLFDDIAYEIGMDFMIEEGYWAKPTCPHIATKMDVSGVSVRGGDYVAGELERAINTDEINDACVKELIELGKNRRKWLVFTAGIQHAEDVTKEIHNAGITVAYITSETPHQERIDNIQRFRNGDIKCLVNVAVLTTGFNVPDIDLLCFMRPTRSPVLYIQTIGRGVRPVYAEGYDLTTKEGRLDAIANSIKPDCMVLDFGGVVAELGPIDKVSIKKKYTGEKEESEKREAITKICPSCGTECAASQRYCYSCSYCFIDLNAEAAEKAIVSMDEEPEWFDVIFMKAYPHLKEGGIPTMKMSYSTMNMTVNEWICFEHHQYSPSDNRRYGWNKAVEWHNKRLPNQKVPKSVEEALEIQYPQPSKILARKDGKYWKIIDFEWKEESVEEDDEYEIPF